MKGAAALGCGVAAGRAESLAAIGMLRVARASDDAPRVPIGGARARTETARPRGAGRGRPRGMWRRPQGVGTQPKSAANRPKSLRSVSPSPSRSPGQAAGGGDEPWNS